MPKKTMNNNKLRNKIEKLISKYENKNTKQEKILKISKSAQKELESLLNKIPKESNEVDNNLNKELTSIHQNFKKSMNLIKKEAKNARKELKQKKKEEKVVKKQKKEQKLKELDNARIETLPELKENDSESMMLVIDGWNIVGCDKIARKCMRGKRGKGAKRLVYLISQFALNSEYFKKNGGAIELQVHFDGNGKSGPQVFFDESNTNSISIDVKYSGKKEIVDDRLVREFGENVKNVKLKESNPNAGIIVVTSDRELTLRLGKIGVTCMKSGCFYKKYLKQFAFDGLEGEESDKNENEKPKPKKEKKEKKEKKVKKNQKSKKNKKNKSKKSKKHWKKYIKNRFSDNSTSSSTSSSDSDLMHTTSSDSNELAVL